MLSAVETLEALINEPDRCAVLRKELLELSTASARSCDRALNQYCADSKLTRVGHGIYGIGRSKVFQIVPEVMPKLGFEILGKPAVKGYSQKLNGCVWILDRPSKRNVRCRGVRALFENNQKITNRKVFQVMHHKPTRNEIADHFHGFDKCHSEARAEKDLVVHQAMRTLAEFKHDDVELAIEGGTALVYYHEMFSRFSEDLDIRVIPKPEIRDLPDDELVARILDAGTDFRDHVSESMPYLKPIKKGRRSPTGRIQTFVFDYESLRQHDDVKTGIKFELMHTPLKLPLAANRGDLELRPLRAINPLEIVAGKFQALTTHLLGSPESYPDRIRHVHDIAAVHATLVLSMPVLTSLVFNNRDATDRLRAAATAVSNPECRKHYDDYITRMGNTFPTPRGMPTWDNVKRRLEEITADLIDTYRNTDPHAPDLPSQ